MDEFTPGGSGGEPKLHVAMSLQQDREHSMSESEGDAGDRTLIERAQQLARAMQTRRSTRSFSDRPVPREVIRAGLDIAASAPSGLNLQAWRFAAISDPKIRKAVRELAEQEWNGSHKSDKMNQWLSSTLPKWSPEARTHLEEAPWLIAVFAAETLTDAAVEGWQNLYVVESACVATGFLVSAFHQLGLSTLVHVPAAADYLGELAAESEGDRLVLIVLVGYEREDNTSGSGDPRVSKKPFHTVASMLGPVD